MTSTIHLRRGLICLALVVAVSAFCLFAAEPSHAASKKKISKCRVTLEYKTAIYDGTAHYPKVTVTYKGKRVKKKYYTVRYSGTTYPGKGKVIIKGKKKFKGKIKRTVRIKVGPPVAVKGAYHGNLTVGEGSYITVNWKKPPAAKHFVVTVKKNGKTFAINGKKSITTKAPSLKLTGLKSPGAFTFSVKTVAGPVNTKSAAAKVTVFAGLVPQTISTLSYYACDTGGSIKLGAKAKTKMTYVSSDTTKATVTKSGKVKTKKAGTVKITINAVQTSHYRPATKTVVVHIVTPSKRIGEASWGNNGPKLGKKKKGDQSGHEVEIGDWYCRSGRTSYCGWTHVLRFKDPAKADRAAQIMEAACKNNYIGYDNRTKKKSLSFYDRAVKANWDVSKINRSCFTACSQLVSACVAGAYQESYMTRGWTYVNARSMHKKLNKTGLFVEFTSPAYTCTDVNLKRGDILITDHSNGENNHTCMVLGDK